MSIQELNSHESAGSRLKTRLSDAVFVAFDTETTGLNPVASRLVELSGVKFKADGTELSTFQSLINPKTPIPKEATAVHGITNAMVAKMPDYEEVVPAFLNWASVAVEGQPAAAGNETVLIAHNAPFDIGFIEVAICKLDLPVPENFVLDTLPLARQLVTDSHNHQLRTLVEHLGLAAETYHRALADSQHVRNLFLAMMKSLPADATLENVVEIGGMLRFMDRSRAQSESRWANQPEFLAIKQAIDDGVHLRIFYNGMRKTERVVTPRSVLFTGGMPYLSAFCHLASAERTFRIDRIIRMETLENLP